MLSDGLNFDYEGLIFNFMLQLSYLLLICAIEFVMD